MVVPDRMAGVQLRDAADTVILGSLVAGSTDWLVTADADLISLRDDFPILRPSEFAVRL
jgi:predicted nucleic acid-binding protein